MVQNLESRIDRQMRISGWNQNELDNARVTLVGSGPLCHYVAAALTGLQVGTKDSEKGSLTLIDNARFPKSIPINEFLYLDKFIVWNDSKVYCLQEILSTMNERMRIEGVHSCFLGYFAEGSNVIVDLTNDSVSKCRSFKFAREHSIPYISASSDSTKGSLVSYDPNRKNEQETKSQLNENDFLNTEFNGKPQGIVPSGVISGLVVDEIRKALFKLGDGDMMVTKRIEYNLASGDRVNDKDNSENYEIAGSVEYKNKRVAVVGAGALGNFVGINLALLGVGTVAFIDYDTITNSNRNRQPCFTFYDTIGKKKVEVITDVLKRMNPASTFEGIDGKIVSSHDDLSSDERKSGIKPIDLNYLSDFDMIISCVDNIDTRLALNNYVSNLHRSTNRVIPLIDGGTGARIICQGNAAVYVPGKNACIDSQLGYSSQPRIKVSCADAAEPSVVYTNLIIGSLLAGEAAILLSPKTALYTIRNPIFYDSVFRGRLKLQSIESQRCYLCAK